MKWKFEKKKDIHVLQKAQGDKILNGILLVLDRTFASVADKAINI